MVNKGEKSTLKQPIKTEGVTILKFDTWVPCQGRTSVLNGVFEIRVGGPVRGKFSL